MNIFFCAGKWAHLKCDIIKCERECFFTLSDIREGVTYNVLHRTVFD